MKLLCQHVDTCLPDYWSGHHLPHVMIPVYSTMTFAEIRQAIKSELSQGAIMGSDDNARLLSADFVLPCDERQADIVTRAAYAAVNRDIKPAKKGARYPFKDIESGEDMETVYAYFVFIEE